MIIEDQSAKIYNQDTILQTQKQQAEQDLEELYEKMKTLYKWINIASCFFAISICLRSLDDLEPYDYVMAKIKRFNMLAYFWNMVICGVVIVTGLMSRYGANHDIKMGEKTSAEFYFYII